MMTQNIEKLRQLIASTDEECVYLGINGLLSEPWYEDIKERYGNQELSGNYRTYRDLCLFLENTVEHNFQIPFMWGDSGIRQIRKVANQLLDIAQSHLHSEVNIF